MLLQQQQYGIQEMEVDVESLIRAPSTTDARPYVWRGGDTARRPPIFRPESRGRVQEALFLPFIFHSENCESCTRSCCSHTHTHTAESFCFVCICGASYWSPFAFFSVPVSQPASFSPKRNNPECHSGLRCFSVFLVLLCGLKDRRKRIPTAATMGCGGSAAALRLLLAGARQRTILGYAHRGLIETHNKQANETTKTSEKHGRTIRS